MTTLEKARNRMKRKRKVSKDADGVGETGTQKTGGDAEDVQKWDDLLFAPRLPKDHEAVQYQGNSPTQAEFCGNCIFWLGDRNNPLGGCSLVDGTILQAGVCNLYEGISKIRVDLDLNVLDDEGEPTGEIAFSADGDGGGTIEQMEFETAIKGVDTEKRLVTGVVLEPDTEDLQGDVISGEDIEQAAHQFIARHGPLFLEHKKQAPDVQIVESWIAPQELTFQHPTEGTGTVRKGSWVMTAKVHDDEIWTQVKTGQLTGLSIRALARISQEP